MLFIKDILDDVMEQNLPKVSEKGTPFYLPGGVDPVPCTSGYPPSLLTGGMLVLGDKLNTTSTTLRDGSCVLENEMI